MTLKRAFAISGLVTKEEIAVPGEAFSGAWEENPE